MTGFIVKGHAVPVRTLRLKDIERALVSGGLATARGMFILGDEPFEWATVARLESLATLWNKYLFEDVRKFLERVVKLILGGDYAGRLRELYEKAVAGVEAGKYKCLLAVYINTIADVIAYMLRYPVYRDPLVGLSHGKERPVFAVHQLLLAARLATALQTFYGRDGKEDCSLLEKSSEKSMNGVPRRLLLETAKFMEALLGGERAYRERLLELSSELLDLKLSTEVEALLYAAPADTRPGVNTTSLLLHLLLVSGVAGSAAYMAVKESERLSAQGILDVGVIRLAGLLHDIGKPVNPTEHVKVGVELSRRLLEGLLPREILDVIVGLIRDHHSREPSAELVESVEKLKGKGLIELSAERLHSILRCADHLAAGYDRLADIVKIVVLENLPANIPDGLLTLIGVARQQLEQLGRYLAETLGEDESQWAEILLALYDPSSKIHRRVSDAYISKVLGSAEAVKLAAKATEALSRLMASPYILKLLDVIEAESRKRWPPDTCRAAMVVPSLAVIDIGGIQQGLSESYRLRSMAGFSLFVDILTLFAVPSTLIALGAAPESIVFAGGGTVHAVVPVEAGEASAQGIRELILGMLAAKPVYALSAKGLKIRVSTVKLDESPIYSNVVRLAYKGLQRDHNGHEKEQATGKRKSAEHWLYTILHGLAYSCDSCGIRPAVVEIAGERYCPICAARYVMSEQLGYGEEGYRRRLAVEVLGLGDLVRRFTFRRDGEEVFDVIALIAGSRSSNYAVVKGDGNAMGAFMASSVTPTMFFERSIRLDLATKEAIRLLAEKLQGSKEALAAFVMGFMYAGGDDFLLILPARIALPAALLLAYEFTANMGFLATTSIGVAAAPVQHNIWWAISASNYLLDEVAKSKARVEAMKSLLDAKPLTADSYVAFDYTDGWGLNSARAHARHEEARRSNITLQPLPVGVTGSEISLSSLLASTLGEDGVRRVSTVNDDKENRRIVTEILEKFLSGEAREGAEEQFRAISSQLQYSAIQARNIAGIPEERALALLYTLSRTPQERPRVGKLLALMLRAYVDRKVIPFFDAYLVYKFARGD